MLRKALLPALLLCAVLCLRAAPALAEEPTIGFNNPVDLSLKDPDGKTVRIQQFKGKVVLLVFWVPGCDECVKQLHKVTDYVRKRKYKDIQYLFVTRITKPEDREKVLREIEAEKLPSVVLFDTANTAAWRMTVTMIPGFFLIDRKGRLQTPSVVVPDMKLQTKTFLDLLDLVHADKPVPVCEFIPVDKETPYKRFEGKPMPDVTAVDKNGKKQANYFYRGFSRLLLVYWSPGCPHCRRELISLNKFYKESRTKQNIEILAIVTTDDDAMKKKAFEYIKENSIDFPVAFDAKGDGDRVLGVKSIPSIFLIDRNGTVVKTFEGEFAFSGNVLNCILAKMKDL